MQHHEQESTSPESTTVRIGTFIVRFKKSLAAVGVLGMGTIAGAINYEHGWEEVGNAAINQIIHSGISAAVLLKIHAVLTIRVRTLAGELVPVVLPAALTTAFCYAIHKFGIPNLRDPSAEPAFSTVPTAVVISAIMPVYHIAHHSKRISGKISEIFKQH